MEDKRPPNEPFPGNHALIALRFGQRNCEKQSFTCAAPPHNQTRDALCRALCGHVRSKARQRARAFTLFAACSQPAISIFQMWCTLFVMQIDVRLAH